jgi:sulfur dioxygenase
MSAYAGPMVFRQLFDPESSTYTYLLGDPTTREAVLIDTVREQVDRDLQIVRELGLRLVATLDTHVHADHVTGAWLLKQRAGSRIVLSKRYGVDADVKVDHGDPVRFGQQVLEVRATPGHTAGCVTYVTSDLRMAFTGDALLIRGCGRTDFQGGDARTLYRSLHDQVFSLPDETLLYPGHDYKGRTVTTVREERLYNPRLGAGKTEDAFVAIMAGLGLPYPKKMDVAVPANLTLGRLPTDDAAPAASDGPWAPVSRTATGAPVVPPEWVADHASAARIVDVRQPDEFRGPLGHVAGAELVPLDTLEHEALAWDRGAPIVLVCRSGGRSERAARVLESLGFAKVASMTGGMQRWNELGLPASRPGDTAQG